MSRSLSGGLWVIQVKRCLLYLNQLLFRGALLIGTWVNRPKQSCQAGSAAGVSPGTPWDRGGRWAGFSVRVLACRLSCRHGSLSGWMRVGSRGTWKPVPGRGTRPPRCLWPTSLERRPTRARRLIRRSTAGGWAWMWVTSHPRRFLSGSGTDSWRSEVPYNWLLHTGPASSSTKVFHLIFWYY